MLDAACRMGDGAPSMSVSDGTTIAPVRLGVPPEVVEVTLRRTSI